MIKDTDGKHVMRRYTPVNDNNLDGYVDVGFKASCNQALADDSPAERKGYLVCGRIWQMSLHSGRTCAPGCD